MLHYTKRSGNTKHLTGIPANFLIGRLMFLLFTPCKRLLWALSILLVAACSPSKQIFDPSQLVLDDSQMTQNPDKLMIVDCLLPGQVRKLGQMTYLSPRRPIKTNATDCEIRGGEYVAFDHANYASALRVWLPMAKEGDANAQVYVGEIYEKGLGVSPDYQVAAHWYQKAADQKLARAQINLGYLYEKGLGVEKDLTQALNYYRAASGVETSDDLQFASSIEARHQEDIKQAVAGLSSEVSELQSEVAGLETELTEKQKKIDALETQLNKTQQKIKHQRQEVNEAEQAAQQTQLEMDRLKQQQQTPQNNKLLSQLARLLKARKQEISKKQLAVVRLQTTVDKQRQQLATFQSENMVAMNLPGPTIEIIDPPMMLTRSIPTARLRSMANEQEIIGKITAPAGLLTLKVNDKTETLQQSGLFRSMISIDKAETSVKVIAIDNQSKKTALEFVLLVNGQPTQTAEPTPEIENFITNKDNQFGNYYGLVIGNNNYQTLPKLESATQDAKSVEKVLREKYGFKTALLLNANRRQILTLLNTFMRKLTTNDNLLIYYAGHGQLDRVNDRGHWLPVDAEINNSAEWISNIALTDIINSMQAKHVIVIADSCYSGTLSRTSLARVPNITSGALRAKWLNVMSKIRSRTVLTSGGLEPVLDTGGDGNHSVFASAFLAALQNNDSVLEGHTLFREVAQNVSVASLALGMEQRPQYAPIRHAGHESGDFFFIPEKL